MHLQECYTEPSGYFLRLQKEMKQCIESAGLNDLNAKIIEAFCNTFGDLSLNDMEDYKRVLDSFHAFTIGVSWTLQNW